LLWTDPVGYVSHRRSTERASSRDAVTGGRKINVSLFPRFRDTSVKGPRTYRNVPESDIYRRIDRPTRFPPMITHADLRAPCPVFDRPEGDTVTVVSAPLRGIPVDPITPSPMNASTPRAPGSAAENGGDPVG